MKSIAEDETDVWCEILKLSPTVKTFLTLFSPHLLQQNVFLVSICSISDG
jgi:hypothetical protein